MFRKLRADEVECRVGTVSKEGKGLSLLLYKDARCDMSVLDETVGPMNWQRSHSRDNQNCTVSIWNEKINQWVSKEDTGTESYTEAEKGLASDSFKRACTNWGIGRELYTAPFIWVKAEDGSKTDKYSVKDIGYDDNGNINKLSIFNEKTKKIVYKYGVKSEPEPEPKQEVKKYKNKDTLVREAWSSMVEHFESTENARNKAMQYNLGGATDKAYTALMTLSENMLEEIIEKGCLDE